MIKKDWFKNTKISFWERLLLRFKPMKISVDMACKNGDYTVIWHKSLKGKIYLVDIK